MLEGIHGQKNLKTPKKTFVPMDQSEAEREEGKGHTVKCEKADGRKGRLNAIVAFTK